MADPNLILAGLEAGFRCETSGHRNGDDSRFCVPYGTPVGKACLNCAMKMLRQSRLCSGCGTPVSAELVATIKPEYGGFWVRLGGQIIDIIVLVPALVILLAVTAVVPAAGGLLFLVAIPLAIYKTVKGQTLGRKLLGMRVVNRNGQGIGF